MAIKIKNSDIKENQMEFEDFTPREKLERLQKDIHGAELTNPSELELIVCCLEGLKDVIEESKGHSHHIS